MKQHTEDESRKQVLMHACGFSDAEARVYLASLLSENTTVRDIAKHTRIYRTSLYEIIKRLVDRGMLGQERRGRYTYIVPTDPQSLLEERRAAVDAFARRVPDMKGLFAFAQMHHTATTYTGKNSLKMLLRSLSTRLKKGDELLVFGDGDAFSDVFSNWASHHAKERVALNIHARFLLRGSEEVKASVERVRKDIVKKKFVQIRILPEAFGFTEGGFDVFGDSVVFYAYTSDPQAVLIRHEVIRALMQGVFELLWNYAEKYTP